MFAQLRMTCLAFAILAAGCAQHAESPPYDVYFGKGEPGSEVSVTSEYGSGATTVNAKGEWELRVDFPGAPKGTIFAVKVKDSLGRSKIFEFVNTAPA